MHWLYFDQNSPKTLENAGANYDSTVGYNETVGYRAGTAQGYTYSNALKNSSVVWEEATLSRWLTDPDKFIPGQKMFVSVPDAKERADIVAYLLQAARPQPSTPRQPGE